MAEGFKYRDYEIFPAGQQLTNGKWTALASVMRWEGNQAPQVVPVGWYPREFDTEQAAATYAAAAARDMIDAGRCKV